MDYDSDYETKLGPVKDVDPYAGKSITGTPCIVFYLQSSGIFFSKERREEVVEIEEDPEVAYIPEMRENVKLMTQGQWMKGCPEGGEQSYLFSLYSQLSGGESWCPNDCGTSIERKKSDFFAIFVSSIFAYIVMTCTDTADSLSFPNTSNN